MSGWLEVALAVLVVAILVVLPLAALTWRRRWLSREGGTFECSVRFRSGRPGAGWVLGMARYNAELLEWFRFFSYSLRPHETFRRCAVTVIESRPPDPVEAVSLYSGQQVVRLGVGGEEPTTRAYELAMSPESLTGLLSWLEAAPPGVGSYGVPTA